MAAASTLFALATTATAIATAIAGASQEHKAVSGAKRETKRAAALQAGQQQELEKESMAEEEKLTASRARARGRAVDFQRATEALGGGGKGGTILTGPLGLMEEPSGAPKTLLGL